MQTLENSTAFPSRLRGFAKAVFVGSDGLRSGWRFFIFNALFLGIALLLLFTRRALTPGGFHGNSFTPHIVALQESLFLVALLLALKVMLKIERRHLQLDFLPHRTAFGRDFWYGIVWGWVAITALLLGMRAFRSFYFGSLALHGLQLVKFATLWAIAFVLVGIFEESFSRGYAQLVLSRGIGFWPAAIINSVLFGAIHLTNSGESVLGIASVVGVALFFCLTLRLTGSLWFAVGFHAMWDYGETFIYGVPDSAEVATGHLLNSTIRGSHWITGGSVGPEGSLLVFVVYGAAALLFSLIYSGRAQNGQHSTCDSRSTAEQICPKPDSHYKRLEARQRSSLDKFAAG